jgi:hypothetical protein
LIKALAGAAPAEPKPFDHLVQGQWPNRTEQQPVDFSHGSRLAQQRRQSDEEINGLDGQLVERFRRASLFCLCLKPVPERVEITAFRAELSSFPFPLLDQMLQTTNTPYRRFPTNLAALVPQHPQLLLALP